MATRRTTTRRTSAHRKRNLAGYIDDNGEEIKTHFYKSNDYEALFEINSRGSISANVEYIGSRPRFAPTIYGIDYWRKKRFEMQTTSYGSLHGKELDEFYEMIGKARKAVIAFQKKYEALEERYKKY